MDILVAHIWDLIKLLGGLAMFLYGMDLMGNALEKKAGSKLKTILASATSNRFKGFLLGLAVTAVIQSSSATTVMVVGFVNSGIMTLGQSIGVIMGANLGTSVTSWIISLIGIESDNFFIQLCKPANFTPILAFIAIVIIMFLKKNSKKVDTAMILIGFAILMFGMETMSDSVAFLETVPEFRDLLAAFSNPILGVVAGAILTAVIQSSSASVGILQAISLNGTLTFGSAIPIIMGQNIGTCVTALLSCIGANKNARRTAVVHLSFNTIGTVVWLTIYSIINAVVGIPLSDDAINPLGIAIIHSVFNVLTILLLFPFAGLLEKLACVIIRDKKTDEPEAYELLDERLLSTPTIAIERSRAVAAKMARTSIRTFKDSLELLFDFDAKKVLAIREGEDKVDKYEDALGTYLVKLSNKSMSEADSHEVSKLLHIIGDLERISDHAVNVAESAEEVKEKGLSFSDEALKEIKVMIGAINEILDLSLEAFENNDLEKAVMVEPLEQVIDTLKLQLKSSHVTRLKKKECTIEMGFILSDLVINLERVSDHCSNIAVCIIEIAHDSFDMHDYIQKLKTSADDTAFNTAFENFSHKYAIKSKEA